MIKLEQNSHARTHWRFIPLTKHEIEKFKQLKPIEIERLYNEWQEKATHIKTIFMRKKGIKMVLCEYIGEYALFYSQRNYDGTYHGMFYLSDDPKSEQDFTSIMNCVRDNANKFMGLAKKALNKKEEIPYNVMRGMN